MKLAIGNIIQIPVKFEIQDNGKPVVFKFELIGDRIDQDALTAEVKAGTLPVDIVRPRISGWSGQKLVLNDDDSPAEFSAENWGAMLKVPGVGAVIYGAFLKASGASEKN